MITQGIMQPYRGMATMWILILLSMMEIMEMFLALVMCKFMTILIILFIHIGQDIDVESADDKSRYYVAIYSDGKTLAVGSYQNNEKL